MSGYTASPGHTTRQNRHLAALDPAHFLIDERSEADLIALGAALAGSLRLDDGTGGGGTATLRALFADDITILLAEIAVLDPSAEYSEKKLDDEGAARAAAVAALQSVWGWGARLYQAGRSLTPHPAVAALLDHFEAVLRQELDGLTQLPPDFLEQAGSRESLAPLLAAVEGLSGNHAAAVYSGLKRLQQAVAEEARRHLAYVLEDRSDHPAQIGLFLAYIRLLRTAQSHLNRYTERHLDFFYRRHLGMRPLPPVPDTAHIWFEPLPAQRPQRLAAGAVLGAGLTPGGQAIEFETMDDLVLTGLRIETMRALQIERGAKGTVYAIREAEGLEDVETGVADRAEGGGWRPFGPWAAASGVADRTATQGLLVSAPVLDLSGGDRTVTIRLVVSNPAELAALRLIRNQWLFRHAVSTADGYFEVPAQMTVEERAIVFTLSLRADDPPVAPLPGGGFRWPCWRLTLAADWKDFAYSRLQALELHDVEIAVTVEGMRSADLRNPEGPVDTSKPFAPFGGIPVPGSALAISSPEWRGKNLTELRLAAEWSHLPEDLGAYFEGYGAGVQTIDYRAELTGLTDNIWQPVDPVPQPPWQAGAAFPLFQPDDGQAGDAQNAAAAEDAAAERRKVKPPPVYTFRVAAGPDVPAGRRDRAQAGPGGIASGAAFRLTLAGPPLAFGHAAYPGLIADASLRQALMLSKGPVSQTVDAVKKGAKKAAEGLAKMIGADLGKEGEADQPINPPFTPMVKDFRIGYSARASLNLAGLAPDGEVYRLESFGRCRQIFNKSALVEQLNGNGYLYIGLRGVDLVNRYPITLLFHINDQAGDNWVVGSRSQSAAVNWSYLTAGGWQRFPSGAILKDETRGLIRSGIVKLDPQHGMTGDVDSPDLVWICVSAHGAAEQAGAVLGVHTQTVRAVRRSPPMEVNGKWTLPAGSIRQMTQREIQVAAVHQPFETVDGQPPESMAAFRLRVSERLRHKNRAVQPKDYEQLTLAEFPAIGDAKCLTGADGEVTVVVAPMRNSFDRMPKMSAGALTDVAEYLHPLMPAGAGRLVVRSPHYDRVRVSAWIDADDRELDALLHALETAADRVIAPWLFDADAPLQIGPAESRVDVSRIQQALSEVPQVRAVSAVSLVLVSMAETIGAAGPVYRLFDTAAMPDQSAARHAEVVASSEWSVLTPALRHRFRILSTPRIGESAVRDDFRVAPAVEVASDDSLRRIYELERAGIGNLRIGSELVICRDPAEVAGRKPVYRVTRQ